MQPFGLIYTFYLDAYKDDGKLRTASCPYVKFIVKKNFSYSIGYNKNKKSSIDNRNQEITRIAYKGTIVGYRS
jgi:hypothetical protein